MKFSLLPLNNDGLLYLKLRPNGKCLALKSDEIFFCDQALSCLHILFDPVGSCLIKYKRRQTFHQTL